MVNALRELRWSSKRKFVFWLNQWLHRVSLWILQLIILRCYDAVLQAVWEALLVDNVVRCVLRILYSLGQIRIRLVALLGHLGIRTESIWHFSLFHGLSTFGTTFHRNFSDVWLWIFRIDSAVIFPVEQHGVPRVHICLRHQGRFPYISSWHHGLLW